MAPAGATVASGPKPTLYSVVFLVAEAGTRRSLQTTPREGHRPMQVPWRTRHNLVPAARGSAARPQVSVPPGSRANGRSGWSAAASLLAASLFVAPLSGQALPRRPLVAPPLPEI